MRRTRQVEMSPHEPAPPTIPALALLCLALAAPPAQAASFPCDRPEAPDERAVCAHRALNDLDVEMAIRFAILADVLPMGGRSKLRDDQEAWLTERRACADDLACLGAAYEARLKVLRGVLSEFAKQGPE